MTIVGMWTVYYDWGCTGTYYHTPIYFNADGTFSNAPAGPGITSWGKWVQVDGMILYQFGPSGVPGYYNTTYSGNKAGNVIVGLMFGGSSTSTSSGCWYATKKGTIVYGLRTRKGKPEFDFTGKKINTKK